MSALTDQILGKKGSAKTTSTPKSKLLQGIKKPEKEPYRPLSEGGSAFLDFAQGDRSGQFRTKSSTAPMATDIRGDKFIASLAGAPLRSGLQIGQDIQNITTGRMPDPINPEADLGRYAAYFLGDEPINALSSDVEASIAGGRQSGMGPGADPLGLIGTTAGAALNLFPIYGSLGRAASKLLAPKVVTKAVENLSPEASEVTLRRFKDLIVKGESREKPVNIDTPYRPDSELPVIDAGPTPKSNLPTVQIGENGLPKRQGSYTYVPVGNGLEVPVRLSTPSRPIATGLRRTQTEKTVERAMERLQVTEGKIAKAAKDIDKKYAEMGFGELPQNTLARYTPITRQQQIEAVSRILVDDLESAKRMALGTSRVPDGVNEQVLFNAVKNYAIKREPALLADLARSPIASARSMAAQTLGASGFNNAFDPVTVIRDIQKIRQTERAGRLGAVKTAQKEKEAVAVEIAKQNPDSWDAFIDEITC